MSINKEGQRAVQAVQNKIKNKFFSEKVSVSMFETNKSKDQKSTNSFHFYSLSP